MTITIRKGVPEGRDETLTWRGLTMFESSREDAVETATEMIRGWCEASPHMNEYRWQLAFWDGERVDLVL